MRLISQDGMIDVPYEQAIIEYEACERNGEEVFHIIFATTTRNTFSVARYSTEAKALKVMDMLRNAYCGLPIIMKNVDISDGVIELLKDLKKNGIIFQKVEENPSVEYVNNTYFKFPKDDDVEV